MDNNNNAVRVRWAMLSMPLLLCISVHCDVDLESGGDGTATEDDSMHRNHIDGTGQYR